MELLWFILIGIAAGWLAGQIMKGGCWIASTRAQSHHIICQPISIDSLPV